MGTRPARTPRALWAFSLEHALLKGCFQNSRTDRSVGCAGMTLPISRRNVNGGIFGHEVFGIPTSICDAYDNPRRGHEKAGYIRCLMRNYRPEPPFLPTLSNPDFLDE